MHGLILLARKLGVRSCNDTSPWITKAMRTIPLQGCLFVYVTVKTPRLLENFGQPTSKLSRKL